MYSRNSDLFCTRVHVNSFHDIFKRKDFKEIGQGSFGTAFVTHAKRNEKLDRLLVENGVWDIEEGIDRVVIKLFEPRRGVYNPLNHGHIEDAAAFRKTIRREATLLQWIHNQVPEFTPKPLACIELVQKQSPTRIKHMFLIFMEYAGETLRSKIKDLNDDQIHVVGQMLIEGTGKLHQHGIIHNDIKPDNIALKFVKEEIKLTFIDMGGACLISSAFKYTHKHIRDTRLECPSSVFTAGYFHPDIYRLVSTKSLDGHDPKIYGCLSSIHDWYGVIGTLYTLLRSTNSMLPALHTFATAEGLPLRSYEDVVKAFKVVFERIDWFLMNHVIMQILDLPVKQFIDGKYSVEDMCAALRNIDEYAIRGPLDNSESPTMVTEI